MTDLVRFTPTGVGTGLKSNLAAAAITVHPHGRGDWSTMLANVNARRGSPPRAWGLGSSHYPQNGGLRFTPTGVGTGVALPARNCHTTVHPHGRGDWYPPLAIEHGQHGSPPRAWGLVADPLKRLALKRFTPTGVGTGGHHEKWESYKAVHPHGRGDWRPRDIRDVHRSGSPPRAWGLAHPPGRIGGCRRFTPTGVGTGSVTSARELRSKVHPHGRGDWSNSCSVNSSTFGSPPRAWGLAHEDKLARLTERFTPTGVGTGQSFRQPPTASTVHPHGRGDWEEGRTSVD